MSVFLPTGITALIKTLRFKWSGEPLPERCIVAFWHSKMVAGWYLSKTDAIALVSPSKDGNYLTSVLKKWKYIVVRGSSSKKGMEALLEAIEMVKDSKARRIVITPDGPRGPKEELKRGAFIAAKELGLPLYFLHIRYRDGMKFMKSWDRFELPYPFSLVEVRSEQLDVTHFPDEKEKQIQYLASVSQQLQEKRK